MITAPQTLEKYVAESRLYSFDFSAKMSSSESIDTIDSIVVTPAEDGAELTYEDEGDAVAVGQVVQSRMEGGAAGVKYKIVVTVTTDAGNELVVVGYLLVKGV